MSKGDARLRFWQRWLLAALGLQLALGYLIAFVPDSPLLGWHQSRVGLALFASAELPPEVAAFRDWVFALLGATIAGWALALAFVVAVPFGRGEPWAWSCVVWSLAAWFPVDTGLSLAHGVWVNALFNLFALAMLLPPLVATRSCFRGREAR